MQKLIILTVVLLVRYSTAQIFCTPNQVTCNSARTQYVRCPADGMFPTMTPMYTCPTTPMMSYCVATVTNGLAPTETPADNSGMSPCLRVTCSAAGIFGSGPPACDVFYTCAQGSTIPSSVNTCPTGQHFRSSTRECVAPELAGCDPNLPTPTPTMTPTMTPTVTGTPTAPTVTGTPTAPTVTGTPTSATVTGATQTQTATATPTATQTPTPTPVVPMCAGIGRIVDSTSCRSFYKCGFFNQRPRKMRCPFQLRYDTGSGRCRRNVNCGSRPDN
ncbi:mucin-2-like [Neocloeon triangulifer]|uniref:mucin-2-like n=1 Tax=Neocloeon triangulifer TaxID=2078957 RepID=UPI00286EBA1D|nr:mucin-2-like [Neocloeon triangulifer]